MERGIMESSLTRSQRVRMVAMLVGGVLVHLSLGTVYTFGNLNPYLTSYMRHQKSAPNLTYTECSWVFAVALIGQGSSMAFGGLLERRIGLRLATLMGCLLMSLGTFLSYLTVQHSFIGLVITYGLMTGLGTGLAYSLPLSCAMKWMPQRKGLMNGIIVAGFGGGAFIFNQVQRAFINPHDEKAGVDKYFSQEDVLNKVPESFLLMGGCYATMQLIGCLLLSNPPSTEEYRPIRESDSKQHHRLQDMLEDDVFSQSESESEPIDFTPLEMIKTKHFYIIFFTFFFMGQGTVFISTLYKAYGLTIISDDSFLSLTGSFAAVMNGLCRIFWGSFADKFSYKVASMVMTSILTCLLLTFQLCELGGKPLFFIYVCVLFGCFSGSFALFPTVTAKLFGRKYMPINYGLVFSSNCFTAPLGVFVSHKLEALLGWSGLFFYVSGSSFVAFLLCIAFNGKDKNNKDV